MACRRVTTGPGDGGGGATTVGGGATRVAMRCPVRSSSVRIPSGRSPSTTTASSSIATPSASRIPRVSWAVASNRIAASMTASPAATRKTSRRRGLLTGFANVESSQLPASQCASPLITRKKTMRTPPA